MQGVILNMQGVVSNIQNIWPLMLYDIPAVTIYSFTLTFSHIESVQLNQQMALFTLIR
jgi:hypothetical protein